LAPPAKRLARIKRVWIETTALRHWVDRNTQRKTFKERNLKMKFYSEETKKFYDTYEACVKAEDEIANKKKAEAARKAELEKNRASAAKEVEAAFKKAADAVKERDKLLEDFVRKYGAFHMSLDKADTNLFDVSDLFKSLF